MMEARYSVTPGDAWTDERLTFLQCRMLGLLGTYLSKDRTAWPSHKTLAERLNVTRKGVIDALNALSEYGYIHVEKRYREDGGQTSNCYTILLDADRSKVTPPVTSEGDPPRHLLEVTPPVTSEGDTKKEPNLKPPSENNMRASAPCRFDEAWKLYNQTAHKARQTKKRAREAWKTAIRKTEPSVILSAIAKEVAARENCDGRGRNRETGEFVGSLPDMHRWLREERWGDVEPDPEPDLLSPREDPEVAMQRRRMEACFAEFVRSGDWMGGRYGWYEKPSDPRADYPAQMYARHGLTKPGVAA